MSIQAAALEALPQLLRVQDLAAQWGLSLPQAYDAARQLPPGVKITLGRRLRIDASKFREWMAAGGTANT